MKLAWVEAYLDFDAKRLAALEMSDVELMDRFGKLHLPSGRNENQKVWSDCFETMSRSTPPPKVSIDYISFLRPNVAVVRVSWRFSEGIWLIDKELIPPFSQIDTYIVIESRGVWFVAAHNMQEKKP